MNTTTSHPAAAAAAALLVCVCASGASAQGGPVAPQRAPEAAIAPLDSPPVLDRGLVGAVAAPAPVGPDSGLVPPDAAPDSGLITADAAPDSGLIVTDAEAAPTSRPIGAPIPLGEPVPRPMPASFLPAARLAADSAPVSVLGTGWGLTGEAFLEEQLSHQRVVDAQLDTKFDMKALFAERGLTYPPRDIYFRLFKQEQVLEVWVRETPLAETYTLLREYPICAISGRLGPKTHIDDFQTPEGFYYVEGFNPESEFHLSLRLNYPNPADRVIGIRDAWGGDIYIHGGCSTVGCFPMTDSTMAELYWLAVEARAAGQTTIPVHVFPARLDDDTMRWLRTTFANDDRLLAFWENLREGYAWFETTRQVPYISVDRTGRYLFSAVGPVEPVEPADVSADALPAAENDPVPLGAELRSDALRTE